MSRHQPRRARKRDANEAEIIHALTMAGATVIQNDDIDLAVGFRDAWYMLEVKVPGQRPRRRQMARIINLSEYAPVHVVHSIDEALAAIGASLMPEGL